MRLASFSKYVPESRVSVEDCAKAAGANAAEAKAFARLFGFETTSCTPDGMPLAEAFRKALDGITLDRSLPDTLIYVHGNPVQYADGENPAVHLAELHPMLAGIETVLEMDQQNCSTLFWALDAAQKLLDQDARSVLILAGDSLHQMPLSERYAPGVTAIGDAFCALLLDAEPGGTRIDNIWLDTRPEHYTGRFGTPEQNAPFNRHHADMVNAILDAIGFDRAAQTPILPHNVNKLSWRLYTNQSGLDRDRIWLDLLPGQGHCYTVDAVCMLDRFQASDLPDAALLSVGQGGFLGGCMVRQETA